MQEILNIFYIPNIIQDWIDFLMVIIIILLILSNSYIAYKYFKSVKNCEKIKHLLHHVNHIDKQYIIENDIPHVIIDDMVTVKFDDIIDHHQNG